MRDFRTGSIKAVAATALAWAVVWAVPAGLIELVDNLVPGAHGFTRQVDMWPQTLGIPGLIGGVLFSILLLIPARGERLAELSPASSGAWGAAAGLLVGALVVYGLADGLSEPWQLGIGLLGVATLLGTVAGAVTPLLFGLAERRFTPASA